MSAVLLDITDAARRANAADNHILTSAFLDACRKLLPVIGARLSR